MDTDQKKKYLNWGIKVVISGLIIWLISACAIFFYYKISVEAFTKNTQKDSTLLFNGSGTVELKKLHKFLSYQSKTEEIRLDIEKLKSFRTVNFLFEGKVQQIQDNTLQILERYSTNSEYVKQVLNHTQDDHLRTQKMVSDIRQKIPHLTSGITKSTELSKLIQKRKGINALQIETIELRTSLSNKQSTASFDSTNVNNLYIRLIDSFSAELDASTKNTQQELIEINRIISAQEKSRKFLSDLTSDYNSNMRSVGAIYNQVYPNIKSIDQYVAPVERTIDQLNRSSGLFGVTPLSIIRKIDPSTNAAIGSIERAIRKFDGIKTEFEGIKFENPQKHYAPVAQLDRVPDYESGG